MIKKIKAAQLKPGMFVHDFSCGWLENPFFKNRLLIKDQEMVDKVVASGIKELFIDTAQGVDAPKDAEPSKAAGAAASGAAASGAAASGAAASGAAASGAAANGAAANGAAANGAPARDELPAGQVVEELPEEVEAAGAHVFSMIGFETKLHGIEPRSLRDELPDALKLRKEMEAVLQDVFEDVFAGKGINVGATVDVSKKMVESVFRNDNALSCIAKAQTTGKYLVSRALNVSTLMVAFARHLGMQPQEIVDLTVGSLLHDVGMLRVNQFLLNKTEKLAPEEVEEIRMHVLYSYDIVSEAMGGAQTVLQMALLHHERFNGSGYPHGVKEEEIPKVVRMLSIVDVFDAITTPRVYGGAINLSAANRKLLEMVAKKEIDETLTHHFIRCIGIYPVGTVVRLSSGRMGIVVKQNPDSLLTPVVKVIYDANKNGFIRPRTLDLAEPPDGKVEEKIVAAGLEKGVRINPIDFLLA